MKTALKYVGLTIQYTFIFLIKFLWAFLRVALSPEVTKGMIKGKRRRHLRKIYRDNDFDPVFHPDNHTNPVKKFKGW